MSGAERDQFAQGILESKDYAEALRDADINTGLAYQIRYLREARGWSQGELGARAVDEKGKPMQQERISELESPDYGRYSLRTLKRLASAFDVNLIVRFAPFGGLADWLTDLPPERLTVPSRLDDPGLRRSDETGRDISIGDSTEGLHMRADHTVGDPGRVEVGVVNLVEYRAARYTRAGAYRADFAAAAD